MHVSLARRIVNPNSILDAGRFGSLSRRTSEFSRHNMIYMYILIEDHDMLAIRLPPEIEERLNKLASKTGRTKTFYAREAILAYLDELEDTYLAADRVKKPGKRWTQDELEQELDLER